MMEKALVLIFLTLGGLCFGSFANVLALRIPRGEEWVRTPSHCVSCGHRLAWYENLPLVSFLLQRGRCRACGVKLTAQYPAVEAACGALWLAAGLLLWGDWARVALYCALAPMLLALSLVDLSTFTIPDGFNLAIAALGAAQLALDARHWRTYLLGAVSVSGFFLLLHLASRGRALGLGDVKLMAAAGLLLGFPRILLAMLAGSLAGSVVHPLRMRRRGASRRLAFGPYLALGIGFSALLGDRVLAWYLGLWGL